jgi:hypothetical protein
VGVLTHFGPVTKKEIENNVSSSKKIFQAKIIFSKEKQSYQN